MGNTFKTAFLLTALTLLLMFIGRAFGGQNGMILALVLAAVMNFVSYFFSDKIALAMYRAQPVTREELPRAYEIVERLTQKIGLPMPKIYVIPTESPNAFATGRDPKHSYICVTQGLIDQMDREELQGVRGVGRLGLSWGRGLRDGSRWLDLLGQGAAEQDRKKRTKS